MVTLYQFEISPFCDKIRRILNYKGVAYETHEVGILESQLGYRKVNPAGKVPALALEDGTIVADSTEIAYALEERHPEPALVPRDMRNRALMHILEDWADESLYFYEVRLRFGIAHNREQTAPRLFAHESAAVKTVMPWILPRLIAGQANAQGIGRKSESLVMRELGRHLDALVTLLAGREVLVGASLSLADIAVFAQLVAIRDSREGGAAVAARPDVVTFMERVDAATRPRTDSRAA